MELTISSLYPILRTVKQAINDDYRAFEEDEVPGIQITVGYHANEGTWTFQTGDNSFMGAAYGYPYWGVAGVYRSSNCREVARDIIDQIMEQVSMDDQASWESAREA